MVTKRLPLPVPKGFFVCPPLNPIAVNVLKQRAQAGFSDLLADCQLEAETIRWKLDSDIDGLVLYSGSHSHSVGATSSNAASILAVTTIQATIDELPSMLRFDSHDLFADFCASYYTDVVDCASLYTLSATESPEYVGIKWEALQSPCSKSFTQRDGVRGYARSVESVDIACVPDLNATFGLVRMQIGRCGFVLKETRRLGVLQAMFLLQADLKGSIPQWMIRLVLRGRAKALTGLDAYFRQRRLAAVAMLSPARFHRVSITSKSGTSLSHTSVLDDEAGYLCTGVDLQFADAYAALDTIVMESVRGHNSNRRQSVPVGLPTCNKPTIRPTSSSAPPLVHLYTPPPQRGNVTSNDSKVDLLLQQLKELDFDDAVLAQFQASRVGSSDV
ncbi:hypothetical protein DYB34_011787 [Aphanomyces astaci]|uniref:START domain-containing protein n=1 Tax=Aphanomyces astaci TaxID=112090 RepID=A0A3R7AJK1_APHAT|nr:hypothetical protein DYB34_011787 [Aphanomyces astaci]